MSAQNILDSPEKILSYLHPLRNEVIKEIETGKIMLQANIIGTGSSIPERILSNKDLESIVDTTDEWILIRPCFLWEGV